MAHYVLASVVQHVDRAIRRINLYPVDNTIGLRYTYRLDSHLPDVKHHSKFEQPRPGLNFPKVEENATHEITELVFLIHILRFIKRIYSII